MSAENPIRANGGVKGFGIDFPDSTKTLRNDPQGVRVVPDPAPIKIKTVEIRLPGQTPQTIAVGGEWEILFLT